MPSVTASEVEAWLVGKALAAGEGSFEAEANLITASTLPDAAASFELAQARYRHERCRKRASRAAEALQTLYMRHSAKDAFWDEVRSLTASLGAEKDEAAEDAEAEFNRSVFTALHPTLQQSLLVELGEASKDPRAKITTAQLLLRLFPASVHIAGVEMVATLAAQLKHFQGQPRDSWFFQVLVCDALPPLLTSSEASSLPSSCDPAQLLSLAVQFLASLPGGKADKTNKDTPASLARIRADPYAHLRLLVLGVAERGGWKVPAAKYLPEGPGSAEEAEKRLAALAKEKAPDEEVEMMALAHLVWLSCAYARLLDVDGDLQLALYPPEVTPASGAAKETGRAKVPHKKMRREARLIQGTPELTASEKVPAASLPELRRLLSLGSLAAELVLRRGAEPLLSTLGPVRDSWTLRLTADSLLSAGRFQEAINLLSALLKQVEEESAEEEGEGAADETLKEHTDALKRRLGAQMASALLGLNRIKEALTQALVTLPRTPPSESASWSGGAEASLVFVDGAREGLGLLQRLLLNALAPKCLDEAKLEDSAAGAALVVCQVGWPRYEWLATALLANVARRKKLHYPSLLDWLERVELLEELAYLTSTEEELDLRISEEVAARKSSHGTRHSHSKARDQVRQALEAKVMKPGLGNAPQALLADFLRQHSAAILDAV